MFRCGTQYPTHPVKVINVIVVCSQLPHSSKMTCTRSSSGHRCLASLARPWDGELCISFCAHLSPTASVHLSRCPTPVPNRKTRKISTSSCGDSARCDVKPLTTITLGFRVRIFPSDMELFLPGAGRHDQGAGASTLPPLYSRLGQNPGMLRRYPRETT